MAITMPCDVRLLPASDALKPGWRGLASFGELWTEGDAALWPAGSGPLSPGEPLLYSVELGLAHADSLAPGEETLGELTFLSLDELRPAIHVGADFELRDGDSPVATGQILGVTGGVL